MVLLDLELSEAVQDFKEIKEYRSRCRSDSCRFIKLCNMLSKFYQNNFIDRFFIDNNKLIK